MPPRQRSIDRGTLRGRELVAALCREIRTARIDRGLTVREVARACGLSASAVSRIERGLIVRVPLVMVAQLLSVVGLELSARAFPGGEPIRDAGHEELLRSFRTRLHASVRWATEVPLPASGDLRAWDGVAAGSTWRYGIEAETGPTDGQALARRLARKQRDGMVDGVMLVLPAGRRTTVFLRETGDLLQPSFPVPGRRALELLGAGVDPGGSAIVVIPVVRRLPRGRCSGST
jgi:transcriptional regulator with XRE-family HTH domain